MPTGKSTSCCKNNSSRHLSRPSGGVSTSSRTRGVRQILHCFRQACVYCMQPGAGVGLGQQATTFPKPTRPSMDDGQVQMATMLLRAGIPTLARARLRRTLLASGTHANAAWLHSPPSPPRRGQNTISTVITVACAWQRGRRELHGLLNVHASGECRHRVGVDESLFPKFQTLHRTEQIQYLSCSVRFSRIIMNGF